MKQIIQIETQYKKVEILESWEANQSAILQAWSSTWTRDYVARRGFFPACFFSIYEVVRVADIRVLGPFVGRTWLK